MGTVDEAKAILQALGLPARQLNDNAAYTLLAFARVGPDTDWTDATAARSSPHGVIEFARSAHGKGYAENTRETIRRQAIHQFVQAGVLVRNPDNPELPTNSPNTHYALTDEALETIQAYGARKFAKVAERFRDESEGGLAKRYAQARTLKMVPVTLPSGDTVELSPGRHNALQRAIVEEFLPRFAPGAVVVYLGDADAKALVVVAPELEALGVPLDAHGKLPDVVVHDPDRNWLFLCEAVTSHGPVSSKRRIELEQYLSDCTAKRVYVSAFLDFAGYKRHADSIAWGTEVWVSESPTHLLHHNGERFIAPHE